MVWFGDSKQAGFPKGGTALPTSLAPVLGSAPATLEALSQHLRNKERRCHVVTLLPENG